MQYSDIRSRAGLVALVFALIISLVSAVPLPSTEFGLSSTLSRRSNGQDIRVQPDGTARISEYSFSDPSRISSLPAATRTLASRETIMDSDDQLVRRSKIGDKIKHAFQSLGHKIKSGFQKFGSLVKHGFQKAGSAIKKGFQKAGSAIKKGFQKVGKGIVTAAKKVWHFVKTTGAKIAKFGLKVVESVGEVVGKVVGFIPGIGKPIDRAIEGISKVAGVISDKIHVNLGKKLEKGMNVMNKADKIMGYIPRRRDLSEEEAFQERDDIALENREES